MPSYAGVARISAGTRPSRLSVGLLVLVTPAQGAPAQLRMGGLVHFQQDALKEWAHSGCIGGN